MADTSIRNLAPAQAAPLIDGKPTAKTVRWLCASGAIGCHWNGKDGKTARYTLSVEDCRAYNRRHYIAPRAA